MGRPKAKDGIRVWKRSRDGIHLICFEEYPGHWFASPEYNRQMAIAWAKRNRERLVRRSSLSIAEYCKGFYDLDGLWVKRQKQKGHHYIDLHLRNKQAYLDNYFAPVFGRLKPQDIGHAEFRREFDNWLLTLVSYLNPERKLSKATKNKIIYSVNDFLEEMVDMKLMDHNPLAGLKKYNKDPENPRGVIDRNSLALMFPPRHADMVRIWGSAMWACLVLVFFDTGMRPGEARALTWADIDIRKRFVPIRKGIEAGTAGKVKGTKTGVVKAGFLNRRTIQELDIWRTETRWNADNNFVFSINGKSPVTNEAITKAFRRGLAQIEKENKGWVSSPEWTPYWLRHSFGTYQMENLDEAEISALMGTGAVVLKRTYQHPDDETLYRSSEGIQKKLDKARSV